MKMFILFVSIALFFTEWYVIRKTNIKPPEILISGELF
ncbi:hypothetical protein D8811_00480 [Streptococcus gordonii]|nr:hypothetical protein D8811_00480 [Streptococcus gordonii]